MILTLSLALALQQADPHPILHVGARVRITWTEPADWLHGTIQIADSRELGIHAEDADEDTRIILDDRTRLQLHRGRNADILPGAIIGGLAGAGSAALLLSDAFGNEGSLFATSQAAFAGGLAGVAVGVIVSSVILGEDVWEDVPIADGRVVYPSLESPAHGIRNADVRARILWERFRTSEAGFQAFYQEHADSLDAIEGLFVRTDGIGRMGIVRDSMFDGWRYVMVNLEPPSTLNQFAFGQILGALSNQTFAGDYRVTRVSDVTPTRARASITDDILTMESGRGAVSHWERRWPQKETEPESDSASRYVHPPSLTGRSRLPPN